MITALMVFHAIISAILILLVLLQFGKGAEAGLLSGAGGDAVMSGSQQGNILSKITIVISIIFFIDAIVLAKIQSNKSSTSILDSEAPVAAPLNRDAAKDKKTTDKKAKEKKAESKKEAEKADPAKK